MGVVDEIINWLADFLGSKDETWVKANDLNQDDYKNDAVVSFENQTDYVVPELHRLKRVIRSQADGSSAGDSAKKSVKTVIAVSVSALSRS